MTAKLLTTEEAAEKLRLTPAGLHNLRYRGTAPPSVRVGKRRLYPEDLLDAWVAKRIDAGTPVGT